MLSGPPAETIPPGRYHRRGRPAMSEKIGSAAVLLACATMAEQATEHELAPGQVSQLTDAQLVDVRTPAEYETSHIAGARHVPLDELHGAAGDLDRDRPVVFYCRTG